MSILVLQTAVRVKSDRAGTSPGELSLLKGDVATLLELKDNGWCVLRTKEGLKGYFPDSWLEPADYGMQNKTVEK
jgi:hypothetical protein